MDLLKVLCFLFAYFCITQSAPVPDFDIAALNDHLVAGSERALAATASIDQNLEQVIKVVDGVRRMLSDAMGVVGNVNKWVNNKQISRMMALEKCADEKVVDLEGVARILIPLVEDSVRFIPKSLLSFEKCGLADMIPCLESKLGDIGMEAMSIGGRMQTAYQTTIPNLMSLGRQLTTCAQTRMMAAEKMMEKNES